MQLTNPSAATDNCRYCLMCRHVCPVGHVTNLEPLTPHGWGLTIASVQRGLMTWNTETVGLLYHCADCGTCRANCVTYQPLPEAIAAARATVTAEGLAPANVYRVGETLATWGNPYGQAAPAAADTQGDVALFVGDDAHFTRPGLIDAVVKLLNAAGIDPILVGRGRNNGYLASSLGFPETARTLAQATLDEVAATGAQRLLVLTPGDLFTFRQLYDERLGIAWPAEVALVEVVTLLAELLDGGKLAFQRTVDTTPYAYLDPTHTVRVLERTDAPRRLLAAVMPTAGKELFWRRDHAHPTGATALQYTLPHMAMLLAGARLEDAHKSGARLLITEAPGDLALLERLAPRMGLRLQGLYELLAAQLA
jgi:Fe-S oxidoreductase